MRLATHAILSGRHFVSVSVCMFLEILEFLHIFVCRLQWTWKTTTFALPSIYKFDSSCSCHSWHSTHNFTSKAFSHPAVLQSFKKKSLNPWNHPENAWMRFKPSWHQTSPAAVSPKGSGERWHRCRSIHSFTRLRHAPPTFAEKLPVLLTFVQPTGHTW